MHEIIGDLWKFTPLGLKVDARVITTNGTLKSNGEAVMGRGCALEAATILPTLPKKLGLKITHHRKNDVFVFSPYDTGLEYFLVTLPTKEQWFVNSDLNLVYKSVCNLVDLADGKGWHVVVMPRPGCGAGNLNWRNEVKPSIERILDDRFYVMHNE